MLKNSKVVLFVTLKSWLGRKILDPTRYIRKDILFPQVKYRDTTIKVLCSASAVYLFIDRSQ
jgi:hypothetical protein